MRKKPFSAVAANASHPRYAELTARKGGALYTRRGDMRSPFERDYTRILHSNAYRRLKHKTQVFFNPDNDHVCTRIEHVMHVESVSSTVAEALGLNTELTRAIATGHDLGHAPFGHAGERILDALSKKHLGLPFWHEQHGVYLADCIELLENSTKGFQPLNLTYAVRDGIVSHCGEVDVNCLKPREDFLDPAEFCHAGQHQPVTYEGCVVKLADKIAYLGRDIEDALSLGILDSGEQDFLDSLAKRHDLAAINTTVLMHEMITDLCENSTPQTGLCLGERYCQLLDEVKRFNTAHIYKSPRLAPFCRYAELVLSDLFETLAGLYVGSDTPSRLQEEVERGNAPQFIGSFLSYLAPYVTCAMPAAIAAHYPPERYENKRVYGNLSAREDYLRAVRDYVAGMTDTFAIKMYDELLRIGTHS